MIHITTSKILKQLNF